MAQDRKSWSVKGSSVNDELVALIQLSDAEKSSLVALQDEAKAIAPDMVKTFYDRLLAHENTKEYLDEIDLPRLQGMTQGWFIELFSGNYDTAYTEQRIKIGEIHVRIGLPIRYPLAMLDVINEYGLKVTAKSSDSATAQEAFHKVLSLDICIFNQAYEDNQIHHLAELVGGERLARLLLSGAQ